MKRIVLAAVLIITFTLGCSDKRAEELYMTAQFEERQNNLQHAKELYRELTEEYPDSEYAKDAAARLLVLNPATVPPK
jgi:outer membrane protein assembly factor BamD (BamD/ComL family)